MAFWKRIRKWGVITAGIILLAVIACNVWVIQSTQARVFSNLDDIPYNKVALVLGTSSRLVNGDPNPFFVNRMSRSAELYKLKKVEHFILSGSRTDYYNEPETMRGALIALGVPDAAITLDLSGQRTFDSIVRSREIFGQDSLTIITQPFHSYRALFISDRVSIKAVAVVANEPNAERGFTVYIREYFARTKAVLDLYLLNTSPEYLGEKEPLKI
jgi:SanA protein